MGNLKVMFLNFIVVVVLVSASASPPATKKAALNVGVTEKVLQGEVDDIQWIGKAQQTVVILTSENVVYLSKDEGKSWAEQTQKLTAALQHVKTSPTAWDGPKTGIKKIVLSKADPNILFLIGVGTAHFLSHDAGRTFELVGSQEQFDNVLLHPKEKNLILASAMSTDCHKTEDPGDCFRSLYMSKDFGKTWTYLTNYIVQFDWVHNLARDQAKGLPLDGIVATLFRTKAGNQKFGYWDKDIDFIYTEDLFKTSNVEIRHGNRFLFTNKFLFVAAAHPERNGEVHLYLSDNGGVSFSRAAMPYEIRQHSYTILDTSEDQVFLHVNHEGDGANWGNVYISNSLGFNYSLSLPHNRRDANGKCDFEKVEGLEGIYLANFVSNPIYRDLDDDSDNKNEPPAVRTVITFDKGAVWGYLRPPTVGADKKPISCSTTDCSLQLHGITDEWGPFYSSENALGLIMATGNVGTHLTRFKDEVNTYFSRDGGLVWYEVAKGSHIYEFGDHGGLIVMANDHSATQEILFSWNEGIAWEKFRFSQTPVHVENIIIEPTSRSQRFLIYGSRPAADGSVKGVVYMLDFADLHERECKGHHTPGGDGDYENWTPSDGRLGGKCLMGRQVTYVRRKRERECFNPIALERPVQRHHCDCTEEDYECDEGYARKLEAGPCVQVKPINITALIPADCPSGTSYFISNGYRKVAGDSCVSGIDHSATQFPCPHWMHRVSHGGWAVLLIVGALVLGLGAASYKGRLPQLPVALPCLSRSQDGPKYTPIGSLEPETAANYPTYADGQEDFGLDLDDAGDDATLLDDGFGSNATDGLGSELGFTALGTTAAGARALPSAPVPAVRAPPTAGLSGTTSLLDFPAGGDAEQEGGDSI